MDLDRVRAVVAPIVTAAGLELYDIHWDRKSLTVSVDKEGGLDFEVIQAVHVEAHAALEAEDPAIWDDHEMTVSSPGVERALRTPEHFRRYVGTTIAVRTQPSVEGERRIQATLDAADDNGITLAGRDLSYDEIERARTVFEWGPAPKPGAPNPNRPKKKAGQR